MSDDFPADTSTTGVIAANGGSATGHLDVNDLDWFRFSASDGDIVRFTASSADFSDEALFIYDASGHPVTVALNSTLAYDFAHGGTYYVAIGSSGNHVGDYMIHAEKILDDFGDGFDTATPVPVGQLIDGAFETSTDEDWVKFDAQAGSLLVITGDPPPTSNALFFTIYDQFGRAVVSDSLQHFANWSVNFTPTQTGDYYIKFENSYGDLGAYNFQITPTHDDFPDDLSSTGVVVVDGPATAARHDYFNDIDVFKVSIASPGLVRFVVDPTAANFDENTVALYDHNGALVTYVNAVAFGEGLSFNFAAPGDYWLAVGSIVDTNDAHNYTITAQSLSDPTGNQFDATAAPVSIDGGPVAGAIDYTQDADVLKFDAVAGQNLLVHIDLNGLPAAYLSAADSAGNFLNSASGADHDLYLEIRESGTYYIDIEGLFASQTGGYSVSVSSLVDDYTHASPGILNVNSSLAGVDNFRDDTDTFAVSVTAGETVKFDVAVVDPSVGWDLQLTTDSAGGLIAFTGTPTNDPLYYTFQTAGTYYVTLFTATPPAAPGAGGPYTISATDVVDDYANNTGTTGVLTVNGAATSAHIDYANDSDYFAITVTAGEVVKFAAQPDHIGLNSVTTGMHDTDGVSGGATTTDFVGFQGVYRFDVAGTYYFAVQGTYREEAGAYTVSAVSVADDLRSDVATTGSVVVGGAAAVGHFEYTEDSDWFAVSLQAGKTYDFALTNAGTGYFGAHIDIYDQNGTAIVTSPGSSTSSQTFTADHSGLYYLAAVNNDIAGTTYNLTVKPNLDLTSSINTGTASPFDTADGHIPVGGSHVINVYFAQPGETLNGARSEGWSDADIAAVMKLFTNVEHYINIDFKVTNVLADADIGFLTVDDPNNVAVFARENADVPIPTVGLSIASSTWSPDALAPGGLGAAAVLNAMGYALGLALPYLQDGHSIQMHGVTDVSDLGDFDLNQGVYTIMSFNDGWIGQANASIDFGWQATPMAIDVAVLQKLYGANTTYNNTDTTYTLGANNAAGASWQSIWDTGGSDTIAFGGAASATIDLRPATLLYQTGGGGFLSYVAGVVGGFSIDKGATIENAIGGSGADTITGNDVANRLTGSAGADTLNGGLGFDTSNYSSASTADSWHRNPDGSWTVTAGSEGTDTLTSVERAHFSDRDVYLDPAQQTFSGDGTSDILWRRSDGFLATWSMNGAVHAGSANLGGVDNSWKIAGTGDFNGDGKDDIAWLKSDGTTAIWEMNSGGATLATGGLGGVGTNWHIAGIGDFNTDGKDDLLWKSDAGQYAIWDMNGLAAQSKAVIGSVGAEWSVQAVADFNGDGSDDILWRRSDGLVAEWNTNGTAQTGSANVGAVGNEWSIVGTGDFNDDGRADILWQRADGATAIWEMNGATQIASGVIGYVGTTWHVAGVGDYNGDGHDDIFWRSDSGQLAVWTMNGLTIETTGNTGSITTDWGII